MTISTSALLQSLTQSAKRTGLAPDQETTDGGTASKENQFLALMKALGGQKIAQPLPGGTTALPVEGTTEAIPQQGQASAQANGVKANGAGAETGLLASDGKKAELLKSIAPDVTGSELLAILASARQQTAAGNAATPALSDKETAVETVGQEAVDLLTGILERVTAGMAPNAGQASTHLPGAGQSQGQTETPQAATAGALSGTSQPLQTNQSVQSGQTGTADLLAEFAGEPEKVAEGRLTAASGEGRTSGVDISSVKVIRQETHFAPSMRLSPIQQIGDSIVENLKAEAGRPAPDAQGLSIKSEGQAVKTLEIQLKPVELGTVKVSLKVVGETVEITMTASNPETVELLKQDRQLLDRMLRATGYKADSITIQAADDRLVNQTGSAQASAGQASGQHQTAGHGGFEGAMQQNGRQDDQQAERQQQTDFAPSEDGLRSADNEAGMDRRSDGGVYL